MAENTFTPQDPENEEISLLDLLQTVVDNLRLLVLGPLAVGFTALAITFAVTPTFTAKTQFLPPLPAQSAAASMLASLGGLAGGLGGGLGGLKNPGDQYVEYLKTESLQNALIERFKLQERYETKTKVATRKRLTAKVKLESSKVGIVSVMVDDKDPQFAADMANAHVEELRKLLARLALTEAQQRRRLFEEQLLKTKVNLAAADVALKATGISSSVLKSNPVAALSMVAALKAQVTAQEVKVGAMRGFLVETAPDFKQALGELANLRSQLAKQDQVEPAISASSGVAAKDAGDYVTKYREYKYQETLFEIFAKQFEIAKVDEAREGAVIQVLDFAEVPELKSKPKKAQIAVLSTLATGFVLLLFVFLRNALRKASQDEASVQKLNAIKASWRRALGK
jgi:uncharacterized protein involved in exopolysaccharide biosynthesis